MFGFDSPRAPFPYHSTINTQPRDTNISEDDPSRVQPDHPLKNSNTVTESPRIQKNFNLIAVRKLLTPALHKTHYRIKSSSTSSVPALGREEKTIENSGKVAKAHRRPPPCERSRDTWRLSPVTRRLRKGRRRSEPPPAATREIIDERSVI
ncbi:hypothetical protein GWI33_017623 [Rhynchophorus ferrugineus]|uniref:Uncharacterized protein n=1 Tax=Rhynchophorus ferrugineus TaxID=354439 RepID=A0A834HV60_RHYFE|nr:hypothetical protein GWI33_017623 [Rhynchophorus ferrugineus]